MSPLLKRFRQITIRILALIFTTFITFLYLIFKTLLVFPHPKCHLFHDFRYNILCCSGRVRLQQSLHMVLNTTLSLLSVLLIVNYCQKMLSVVQWVSHQTHLVFLSFVLPLVPEVTLYTPKMIVLVYLILSYLGITAQLSLTLDLIYLYNLPTIYMYKILALSYSKLLTALNFCLQVFQYDQSRWLTCKYKFLIKTERINKVISTGLMLTLGQILVIVTFYYLWLAVVIIFLLLLINLIRNFIQLVRNLSSILLSIKGYTIQSQFIGAKEEEKTKLTKLSRIFLQIQINWIPLIKLQDIKDVFIGKDIIRSAYHLTPDPHHFQFSVVKVYESFIYFGTTNLNQ